MNTSGSLRVGMQIWPQSQRFSSLLSVFAANNKGMVFGLTARHVLMHGASPVVLDGLKRIVGHRTPTSMPSALPQQMSLAIGLFKVSTEQPVDASFEGHPQIPEAVAMDDLLGESVFKLDPRGAARATIVKLFGTVRMVDRIGGYTRRYFDAIELRPENPDDFAIRGDAGALIVTSKKQPVGILIAGEGSRFFAAPLSPLLREHGLHLLTAVEAARHNRNVAESATTRASTNEFLELYKAELDRSRDVASHAALLDDAALMLTGEIGRPSAFAKALENIEPVEKV